MTSHAWIAMLTLALVGCNDSTFEFEGLPCSIPAEVTEVVPPQYENQNGCWMLIADDAHGYVLGTPGTLSCASGARCIVITTGERVWTVGVGTNDSKTRDVDCATTC